MIWQFSTIPAEDIVLLAMGKYPFSFINSEMPSLPSTLTMAILSWGFFVFFLIKKPRMADHHSIVILSSCEIVNARFLSEDEEYPAHRGPGS